MFTTLQSDNGGHNRGRAVDFATQKRPTASSGSWRGYPPIEVAASRCDAMSHYANAGFHTITYSIQAIATVR